MYRFPVGPRTLNRTAPGVPGFDYRRVEIKPLGVTIGAEIVGLDLRKPLDDALFEELDAAFSEWKVLVFKDQHLSPAELAVLASRWGPIVQDSVPQQVAGGGEILRLPDPVDNVSVPKLDTPMPAGRENIWHCDGSYRTEPVLGTMMLSLQAPELGGDTAFVDMAAAYDNLDEQTKARIDGLWAEHDWSAWGYAKKYEAVLDEYRAAIPPARHPVVVNHPRTGRPTLFVNRGFTTRILGLEERESDELLDILTRQADVLEYQFRARYDVGTLVFWDNVAVQHYGVIDSWPAPRAHMRATMLGDWPYGQQEERKAG